MATTGNGAAFNEIAGSVENSCCGSGSGENAGASAETPSDSVENEGVVGCFPGAETPSDSVENEGVGCFTGAGVSSDSIENAAGCVGASALGCGEKAAYFAVVAGAGGGWGENAGVFNVPVDGAGCGENAGDFMVVDGCAGGCGANTGSNCIGGFGAGCAALGPENVGNFMVGVGV